MSTKRQIKSYLRQIKDLCDKLDHLVEGSVLPFPRRDIAKAPPCPECGCHDTRARIRTNDIFCRACGRIFKK